MCLGLGFKELLKGLIKIYGSYDKDNSDCAPILSIQCFK
jgi:hypothetical protein